MAKRKLSRTDPRTSGSDAGRRSSKGTSKKSASRSSSNSRSERTSAPRKVSDKPSDKRRSSRSGEESREERPRRGSSTRSAPRAEGRGERSFDKKRTGGRPERGGSRPFNADAKPRRGFPEGFKRDDDERPRRTSRPDGERPSFRQRSDSPEKPFRGKTDNPFPRKREFDKDENPERRSSAGRSRRDDSERPARRTFSKDETAGRSDNPFTRKRNADETERPVRRDEDSSDRSSDEERPARRTFSREEPTGRSDNPFTRKRRAEEDERPARRDDDSRDSRDRDDTERKPFGKRKPFESREVKNERGERRPRKSFTEGKTISSRGFKDRGDAVEEKPEKMRLNRYIANSGVSSRREADEIIKMGLVTVNGKTITEMGYQVQPGDVVKHEGKMLRAEKHVYVLMNKPKGYLTTTRDPDDRMTVMQLVASHIKERIYPVGRLDRNTTGLLLLTNDGALAEQLSHPSYNVKKIYKVELDRPLARQDFEKIGQGVQLEEGRAMVDDIAMVSDDGKTVGLEIHIGWNRVVRRIFESLEYQVMKLDRTIYAGLDKKDLPRGNWRHLREEEVIRLKHLKKGT
ncbi:ribosomal large subunit pseudouridine synthase B [Chryseotalea sanaruensis]|uniref:Pseudouridine synthase n=1 Tax=Chryseotalea sanaruensis TaxID=2482724 RepID=A0A401U7X8_9BACT|nr:pseudouridine synthase [Chryseotalea sanaruensis]GCC50993.1 ribosomal large subunit pseudouridine synthase B [Chryseotalea sanaruensis]